MQDQRPGEQFSFQIRKWMEGHAEEYLDCGEVNCTALVEAWEQENTMGSEDGLDSDHIAWDIAVEVAVYFEHTHQRK